MSSEFSDIRSQSAWRYRICSAFESLSKPGGSGIDVCSILLSTQIIAQACLLRQNRRTTRPYLTASKASAEIETSPARFPQGITDRTGRSERPHGAHFERQR